MGVIFFSVLSALLGLALVWVRTLEDSTSSKGGDSLAAKSLANTANAVHQITKDAEAIHVQLEKSKKDIVSALRAADFRAMIHSRLLAELARKLPESFVLVESDTLNILITSDDAESGASSDLIGTRSVKEWDSLWKLYLPDGIAMSLDDWPIVRICNGEIILPEEPVICYSVQESDGAGAWFELHGHPMYDDYGVQVAAILYFKQVPGVENARG